MPDAQNSPLVRSGLADDPSARCASLQEIRRHFPALERRYAGVPVAYFDGPGGTQVPDAVVDAMVDYLRSHNANTHWNYPTSAETDEIIDSARAAVADLVGGSSDEIVFGANATTLAFHLSRALGLRFCAGDEILITELDHHANVGPWQALERERGCVLRMVKMNTQDCTQDWRHFEQQLNGRTKLVAIGAASNAVGTVNDVARACRIAKAAGALSFVDAVHFAPHYLPDVQGWNCDFLVCSAYKLYGPHIGAMWCRRELLESLPFAKVAPAPDTGPCRAETGTQNHEGIAGAAAAIDFLASLAGGDLRRRQLGAALSGLHERSSELVQQLWSGLGQIDGVTIYGPPPDSMRTPTVAFTVHGIPSSVVAGQLAERSVFVSHGNFYAATLVERLGLGAEGLVRAGCACYTSAEEVERLITGVRAITAL